MYNYFSPRMFPFTGRHGPDSLATFTGIRTKANNIKVVSINCDKKIVESILLNNILTYFPSYRYETPAYLNDPYKITLDFKKEGSFDGYLPNPIEVVSNLHEFANWLMDIVVDNLYGPDWNNFGHSLPHNGRSNQ